MRRAPSSFCEPAVKNTPIPWLRRCRRYDYSMAWGLYRSPDEPVRGLAARSPGIADGEAARQDTGAIAANSSVPCACSSWSPVAGEAIRVRTADSARRPAVQATRKGGRRTTSTTPARPSSPPPSTTRPGWGRLRRSGGRRLPLRYVARRHRCRLRRHHRRHVGLPARRRPGHGQHHEGGHPGHSPGAGSG